MSNRRCCALGPALALTALAALFAAPLGASLGAQTTRQVPDSVPLIAQVNALGVDFHDRLAAVDRFAGWRPTVVIERESGLLFYNHSLRLLRVPLWSAMDAESRALYATISTAATGTASRAEYVFDYIRWFFVPHELAHQFIIDSREPLTPWEHERRASAFAWAYWNERGEQRRLAAFKRIVQDAVAGLAHLDPTPPGRDRATYFNEHYRMVMFNHKGYTYLQLLIVADLMNASAPPTLLGLSAALPPRSP